MPNARRVNLTALRLAAAAFALASLVAVPAAGQALYRLVGKDGKVTYSDRVPKGFDGEVTRIETDPQTNAIGAAPAGPASGASAQSPGSEINEQRKARRLELAAALESARAKLAAAKLALAEGSEPRDGEWQTIQQRFDASGAKPGTPGPRPTCMRQKGTDGRDVWICPTRVPGSDFFDRQKSLEEAVRLAEAEVEAAEYAYRRGVD